ncbi:hypothetical protein HNQ91_003117 [Filimonas zeae]|uniref:Uncharacterized protein n=1 Tax=Filimonas zeae TaxID=1737353 RepID=A0A917J053_9BACT|nr:hypothetical protein [Filimonas zeae]MDR6340052.1 hypothetical protein [Filimonas zeae]GGH70906.1 hypothetical protein GCM10011379_29680 [Filimonas zeae]
MIFGSTYSGHVKTQNHQWVESKVVAFFIPIAIPSSFLVTEVTVAGRRGIELNIVPVSVTAILLRAIVTVIAFFAVAASAANVTNLPWLIPVALASLVAFYYAWFVYGKTQPEEMLVREAFYRTTGFSVLPEWLRNAQLTSFYSSLYQHYQQNLKDREISSLDENALYRLLAFRSVERIWHKRQEPHADVALAQELLLPGFTFVKK